MRCRARPLSLGHGRRGGLFGGLLFLEDDAAFVFADRIVLERAAQVGLGLLDADVLVPDLPGQGYSDALAPARSSQAGASASTGSPQLKKARAV